MAEIVQFQTQDQEKEARLVAGMADKQRRIQNELYTYCSKYFKIYKSIFSVDEYVREEIFQNSFITLWENIERGQIYVKDGILMGKDNMPFRGSILTYFMSIARYKYLEIIRKRLGDADFDKEIIRLVREEWPHSDEYDNMLYDSGENMMLEIIADVLSKMPTRCYQILTKFYYEEKKLDVILNEIRTITSYDALKTRKNKCFKALRDSVLKIYDKNVKHKK